MTTEAKVIADSVSPDDVRLTTMQVTCHRFVLAEFNTHRVFSRNSASSRAIPLRKQIEKVDSDLAMPVAFPAEQKGMQGGEALDEQATAQAQSNWDKAADNAIEAALAMGRLGVHKSVANRLLEPFMWHTIVVTSTAWENFFTQRCSPMAQPEIRVAAEAMREAMSASEPAEVDDGEWHLPYVGDDEEALDALAQQVDAPAPWDLAARVSAARCARVSYLTQDGVRDPKVDLALYDRLVTSQPPHWSPLEHVATPWPENRQEGFISFDTPNKEQSWEGVELDHLPRVGNLLGWRSLRTTVEAERKQVTYR